MLWHQTSRKLIMSCFHLCLFVRFQWHFSNYQFVRLHKNYQEMFNEICCRNEASAKEESIKCLYSKKQRATALVDDSLSSGRLLLDCYRQICVQCPSDKQTWCSQTIKSEKSVKINTPWKNPTLLTLMLLCCKYLQHISRLAPDWRVQTKRKRRVKCVSKSLDFYTNIHIFLLSQSTMYDYRSIQCKLQIADIKSQVI